MNNANAVQQLSQSLGLSLELADGEACELIVGDDLSILISGDPNGTQLRLMGVVASFPDGDRSLIATTLLKANYNGQGTGPAALALDPLTEDVVLTRAIDAAASNITSSIEEFANYLDFWRTRLESIVGAGDGAVTPDASPISSMRV
ncbi:MAG TPA: type III secretion system chaperone [Caulifigura sp.]|nr:type III secretion system chaperone [Caulifigura sp.]